MSQERQPGPLVRTLGLRLPSGFEIETHQHPWAQLIYAAEGVLTVETASGSWVVPPARAAWIPAGFQHSLRTTGQTWLRTLYLAPEVVSECDSLPHRCCVMTATPLLRELVFEAMNHGMLHSSSGSEARLVGVILDQIVQRTESPLDVRRPVDPRARHVAAAALKDLSTPRTLVSLATGSGASVRTIERLFRNETGMTFGQWLRRCRVLRALERLAAGDSVTEASLAVGYDSTSAFVAMFKRTIGDTPGAYYRSAAE